MASKLCRFKESFFSEPKSVLASDVSILFQDEVQCLVDFLAQPNVVSILDLSSTDIPSEVLFSALVRGCTQHLSHLNLARNPFLTKKSKGEFHKVLKSIDQSLHQIHDIRFLKVVNNVSVSKSALKSQKVSLSIGFYRIKAAEENFTFFLFSGEIPATFKQFFAMTLGLKYLNLSHCKLPIDALKHLLLGLACNEVTSDVELNISNNNIGGAGAGVVENALPGDQE